MSAELGQAIRKARREYKDKLLARLELLQQVLKPADPDVVAEGDYIVFDLEATHEQIQGLLPLCEADVKHTHWKFHAPWAADLLKNNP